MGADGAEQPQCKVVHADSERRPRRLAASPVVLIATPSASANCAIVLPGGRDCSTSAIPAHHLHLPITAC